LSVLLDTHVWIWWLMGQPELPVGQRVALDRLAERELPFLSAISLWEAQMLNAKGRLKLNRPFERWLREAASPEVVRSFRSTWTSCWGSARCLRAFTAIRPTASS